MIKRLPIIGGINAAHKNETDLPIGLRDLKAMIEQTTIAITNKAKTTDTNIRILIRSKLEIF